METLNSIIDKNFDSEIDFLKQIVAIESIGGDAVPSKPYGEKCAQVLDVFLKKAESMGFKTKNHENYVGTIEFNEKKTQLGVLCHLDVVPVTKEDWTHDPFGGEIENGRIFGRGTIDDKGPAAAVLFALKALKESGLDVSSNVRFIVGCDEERGSSDMEYYMKKEKMPPFVFTPDGDYPVINIEKGMLRLKYEKKAEFTHIRSIKGGTVVNAVPASSEAVVVGIDADILKKYADSKISVKECEDGMHVFYRGTAAHASTPQSGDNAITGLFEYLNKLPLDEAEKEYMDFLTKTFVYGETDGAHLGIKMTDEKSGDLTEVLSIIDYDGKDFSMKMDIRYPLCTTKEEIKDIITKTLSVSGTAVKAEFENDPHCVDENSDFVKTLLSVYHEQTGLEPYAKAIGGGTYVHDIDGGVAFGAEFPGDENNMHGNDESMSLESLKLNTRIIANAIYELIK